jgi:hypothetical protein
MIASSVSGSRFVWSNRPRCMDREQSRQTECVFSLSDFLLLDTYIQKLKGGGWGLKYIEFFFFRSTTCAWLRVDHLVDIHMMQSMQQHRPHQHQHFPKRPVGFCLSVDGSETGYSPDLIIHACTNSSTVDWQQLSCRGEEARSTEAALTWALNHHDHKPSP